MMNGSDLSLLTSSRLRMKVHGSRGDYSKWITDMDHRSTSAKMNSRQNGLLLAAHIHTTWDIYMISVNPDVSDLFYSV